MMTQEAALELFDLPDGASAANYDALSYMGITVQAKPGTRGRIPAVIHEDGSARVQIVDRARNPLAHAFLKAMGARGGVEVAVNTSLNIRSPIAASVAQAVDTLRRAQKLDLLLVVDSGAGAWAIGHSANARSAYAVGSAEQILSAWMARRSEARAAPAA
jgi:carbamoyltransferase